MIYLGLIFCILSTLVYYYLDSGSNEKATIKLLAGESLKEPVQTNMDRIAKRISIRRRSAAREKVEQYFGVFLEQIVLAVNSGLDVYPAIVKVVEINRPLKSTDLGIRSVNNIFEKICELVLNGVPLYQALRKVGNEYQGTLIPAALMHLALAHKMGGELSRPLQEISDGFQEQIQNKFESKLQTLPLRATIPLLFIFAGMIIMTLSIPLLRILEATSSHAILTH